MDIDELLKKPTRRAALLQIAGTAGVFPILGQNPPPEVHHSAQPVTKQVAKAYQFRFFSQQQLQTLNALGETIIPRDEHSGGAKEAHVSEYIDAIIADELDAKKQLWREGLASVEQHSHAKFQKGYTSCSPAEQTEILRALAGPEEQDPFFKELKRTTIDGYYTSPVGIFEDLDYHGNQALQAFPGCQLPEIKSE